MAKEILNRTAADILTQIDKTFQEAYVAVRKRKAVEEVWEIWGDFMVEMKMGLEQAIQSTGIPYIGWIYAYLQNRNQILNLNIETRIGKAGMKKDIMKSGNILISLITGLAKTGPVDEVNEKVALHLKELYSEKRYDTIIGKKVFVTDYPPEISEEPEVNPVPQKIYTNKKGKPVS